MSAKHGLLRKDHKLRVFENSVLREHLDQRIINDEEEGENYKTKGSLIYTFYQIYYGDHINENEMGRACRKRADMINVYRILNGKPGRKTSLGRPRHRKENNIAIL
jgi:hypothetical protein